MSQDLDAEVARITSAWRTLEKKSRWEAPCLTGPLQLETKEGGWGGQPEMILVHTKV